MSGAHKSSKIRKLRWIATLAIGVACVWTWARERELVDPDVRRIYADCDAETEPAGLYMPSMPDEKQRFWTRQRWTDSHELKVEVWQLLEPGHRLVSADRKVTGNHIVIEPRWVIPFMSSAAACYDKFGIEVTFHDLPRRDYVIDAR
jgi:hypothetical protein